jgi:phosphopantothenoylcysteine decarboxylase/phosphopantothenate--cysteine ligase
MPKGKTNFDGLNVLLGVSGGISAYKAVDLASKLVTSGASVKTVMTDNACRLVGPKSFEAITCSQVYTSLWSKEAEYTISHVNLVDWAHIIVVTPATANIIGKVANGIYDDLLSTTLCVCWKKPVLLAPAMNSDMWENPAVRRNIMAIEKMGFELIGPEKGRLACGTVGTGRMAEPANILERIEKIASQIKKDKN